MPPDADATACDVLVRLAGCGDLGSLLTFLDSLPGGVRHLDHWQQGEFHHDHVLLVPVGTLALPGEVLVAATNCNGALKEILCLATVPERWGLWGWRVPESQDFAPGTVEVLAFSRTRHWFDPRRLLLPDTRSELRPECRRRQRGGGWVPIDSAAE